MVHGYSSQRRAYPALDIDFYKKISHAFIKLVQLRPQKLDAFHVCRHCKMETCSASAISASSTPPATIRRRQQRAIWNTQRKFAQQSGLYYRLIALGTDGTVPESDLEFIQRIGVEGRSVYVVLQGGS